MFAVVRKRLMQSTKTRSKWMDIKDIDEFTYLGATVCKEGGTKDLKN